MDFPGGFLCPDFLLILADDTLDRQQSIVDIML
jgi:hypothetical protein